MSDLNKENQEGQEIPAYTFEQTLEQGGQDFGSTPYGQPETALLKPKKKKKTLAIVFSIVLLLGIGISGAFIFARAEIANTFALNTKSDVEYYRYIEEKNREEQLKKQEKEDVVVSEEKIENANLQVVANGKLSDEMGKLFETLSAQEFTLESELSFEETGMNGLWSLLYQNAPFLSGFVKTEKESLLLSISELQDGVLDFSNALKSYLSEASLEEATVAPGQEIFQDDFFVSLSNIAEDVKVEKGSRIEIKDHSFKCTNIKATINGKIILQELKTFLEKYGDDPAYAQIFTQTSGGATVQEGIALFDQLLQQGNVDNINLEMTIYVNSKGQILGRQFSLLQGTSPLLSFSYKQYEDGNQNDLLVDVKYMGVTLVTLDCDLTEEEKKSNGTIKCSFPILEMSGLSIDPIITYEMIEEEKLETREIIFAFNGEGEVPLPPSNINLLDCSFKINYERKKEEQEQVKMSISFLDKKQNHAEFNLMLKDLPYKKIETFDASTVKRYDVSVEKELEQYILDSDPNYVDKALQDIE